MNPSDINGDEALEARITAWILGEASAFEAAELERLCASQPQLAELRTRLAELHGQLVQSHKTDDSWKLSPAKRQEIEALIGTVPAKPRRSREYPIFLAVAGIAACFVIVSFFWVTPEVPLAKVVPVDFLPASHEDKTIFSSSLSSNEKPELAPGEKSIPLRVVARGATSALSLPEPDADTGMAAPPALAENLREAELADGMGSGMPAVKSKSLVSNDERSRSSVTRSTQADDDNLGTLERGSLSGAVSPNPPATPVNDPNQSRLKSEFADSAGTDFDASARPAMPSGVSNHFSERQREYAMELDTIAPESEEQGNDKSPMAQRNSSTAEKAKPTSPSTGQRVYDLHASYSAEYLAGKNHAPLESDVAAAEKAFPSQTQDLLMRKDETFLEIQPSDSIHAELLSSVDSAWELSVPADGKKEKSVLGNSLLKQLEEIPAAAEAFSTFSLNISDASFRMAKAVLDAGQRPEASSIKVEQFYNAFDYADPAPSQADAIAGRVEQAAHPFLPSRNLVRISLKTAAAGRASNQPLRLTLLVDQSGSMLREDRRVAMDRALSQLGGMLKKDDRVSVIGFARTPRLLADGLAGDQAGQLVALANSTANEGGTNLELALDLAEELAQRHQLAGAQNRIVLFTDGAANLGDANPARLSEKITELRQKGISFDIAGLGTTGVNDMLLSELARHGNGRYYLVSGNDDFAAVLAGAFHPAAENVKVQVRFNPERVGHYQLLGFEQDRLKTEDFHNDKVDAAELSAEEAGIALYQVEPLAEGKGELGEVSVRFKNTATGEMIEQKWTLPYDPTAPAFDRASPSLQLAGLALFTAEKLRGGPLADAIDLSSLASSIAKVQQTYSSSRRVNELLQMIGRLK